MALEIIKNGLAKNKIRGPFRPRGVGQNEIVPGPLQSTFFIFEPFPNKEIRNNEMVMVCSGLIKLKVKTWKIFIFHLLMNKNGSCRLVLLHRIY